MSQLGEKGRNRPRRSNIFFVIFPGKNVDIFFYQTEIKFVILKIHFYGRRKYIRSAYKQ